MAQFSYTAKQGPTKLVEGIIDAETIDAAIGKIVQLGYSPVDIKAYQEKKRTGLFDVRLLFHLSRPIRKNQVMLFTRQLGDLVDANVPILQGLKIVAQQTRHPEMKILVDQIYEWVRDGESLSGALTRYPQVFPSFYVNMVRAGELGGNMDIVLLRLSEFLEKDQETRSQVHTSLIYPAIVLGVAGLTITALFVFVIPRMITIFEDLQENLPLPTRVVIGISDLLVNFWWLILLLVLGGVFYFQKLHSTEQGKARIDQLKMDLPFFGNFIKTAQISRVARSLGTLLGNGVMIVPALEAVEGIVDNVVLRKEIKNIALAVANGSSLAAAFKSNTLFPDAAVSMISVGEESGQVHKGLNKLAEYYEKETQRFVKRLTSLIEPVLILFLGGVVGAVFLALMLPILQMNLVIK